MASATETWQVEVDRTRCMGTAACVYAKPAVFALGDDGTAQVVGPVDGTDEELADAVAECPTAALSLTRTSATD